MKSTINHSNVLNKSFFTRWRTAPYFVTMLTLLGAMVLGTPLSADPISSGPGISAKTFQRLKKTFSGPRHFSFKKDYGRMPMAFEANVGQTDPTVQYIARGNGYSLFVTDSETVMSLSWYDDGNSTFKARGNGSSKGPRASGTDVLRLSLTGASRGISFEAQNPLPGASNYFIGKDRGQWKTRIRQYSQVVAHDVYPGVDMVYYGKQGQLEYDFHVKPGADPKVIRVRHAGADSATVDDQGNLHLAIDTRGVRFKPPTVYQENGGVTTIVSGNYVTTGKNEIGFEVGDYDKTQTLIIDPSLDYSTYLGGAGLPGLGLGDFGAGIAVDTNGNAYVVGYTTSTNFPTITGAYQSSMGTYGDVFITKMNADGTALVYSTYLGGNGDDRGCAVVLDASNDAYVTGQTHSTNFPTASPGGTPYQTIFGGSGIGDTNAFVTELDPTGSTLLYSTYLGGSNNDTGTGIALDTVGNIYISGSTDSTNFPVASAYQTALAGVTNAFIAKLNPGGNGGGDLLYSTYLGGSGADMANGIALDTNGNAYVTGSTTSATSFPTTGGIFQTALAGVTNAFVAKINPSVSGAGSLVYSTYLGGGASDAGNGIALDSAGDAYITGSASSTNFPTTSGAYQTAMSNVNTTAFLTVLNPTGTDLVYSTYLGGNYYDEAAGIAVDTNGTAYLTGQTYSGTFPTTAGAYQSVNNAYMQNALDNAFITMLYPGGNGASDLVYSSYLGGSYGDHGSAIALGSSGAVYLTGLSGSGDFPLQPVATPGAFQSTNGNITYGNAFVASFDASDFVFVVPPTHTATNTATVTATNTVTDTGTSTATGTSTNTATETATVTASNTATNSTTATPSFTATDSTTATPSLTASQTATNTATVTSSNTATNTATASTTATPSLTATDSTTATPSLTASQTATNTATVTSTNTATNSTTATPSLTASNTATSTTTVTSTQTATNSTTATPSLTASQTATNTGVSTSTFTNTPTTTMTYTKTVTPTATPTDPLSNLGKTVLGPVPLPRGGNLCLFPDKPVSGSQWDVFDMVAESIASVSFSGSAQACWNTAGVPPGIYIARVKLTYSDGTSGTIWQKILVTR